MASTNVGSIHYDLGLDTTKFNSSTNKAMEGVKKFSKVCAVAFAAIGAAAVAFGAASVKSYMQQEDALAGLEAGLKNTGEEVTLVSAMLQKQASALQKVTKFSDEEIISADAMLTTFQLQGKTIEKLTPSLLDMAEGLRDADGNTISLSDAAKMMGKVMGNAEGGIEGMSTALKRNGVIMTDAEAEIFKTGTETERLDTLTRILSYNFGGRALAAGKTYSGQFTIMSNQIDEVKESIGLAILEGIQPLMDKLKEFVDSDEFKGWLEIVIKYLRDDLPGAARTTWEVIKTAWTIFSTLGKIIWGMCEGIAMFIYITQQIIKGVVDGVRVFVVTTGDIIVGVFNGISSFFSNIINVIIGAFNGAGGWLYQKGRDLIQGFVNGVKSMGSAVYNAVNNALSIGGGGGIIDWWDSLPLFASGTNFAPGGMAIVGERGPELVNLPRGSQVIPNDKLGGAMGQTSIYGDVNIGSESDADYFFTRLNRSSDLMGMGLAG